MKCAICGWPINRTVSKNLLYRILEWIKSNGGSEELVEKILSVFSEEDIFLCRYDFFYLIKDIIEKHDEKLAEKFEKLAMQYEFGGSLIS